MKFCLEKIKMVASQINFCSQSCTNIQEILNKIVLGEEQTHPALRRRDDVVRMSLCTSQRRQRYDPNKPPNDVSKELRQDVSVVRLHDVLLERRNDVSKGRNNDVPSVRLPDVSNKSQMKHPTTSQWYITKTSQRYVSITSHLLQDF